MPHHRQIQITVTVGGNYMAELKERLEEYGIKQVDIATAIGRSESQVSRWFNKDITPRLETVAQIEDAILHLLRDRQHATHAARRIGPAPHGS